MPRLISNQIDKLFSSRPAQDDTAVKFAEVLRGNLRLCAELIDRRVTLLFLSLLAFELLSRAAASEVSLMGLKIKDLALMEKLIPLGIAYLYYSVGSILSYRRLLEEAHDRLMEKIAPEYFSNDLQHFAHPPTLFLAEKIIAFGTEGRFRKFEEYLVFPLQFAIAVGPGLYLLYAITQLFWRFGFADVIVYAVAAAAVVFVSQVVWLFAGIGRITVKSDE